MARLQTEQFLMVESPKDIEQLSNKLQQIDSVELFGLRRFVICLEVLFLLFEPLFCLGFRPLVLGAPAGQFATDVFKLHEWIADAVILELCCPERGGPTRSQVSGGRMQTDSLKIPKYPRYSERV